MYEASQSHKQAPRCQRVCNTLDVADSLRESATNDSAQRSRDGPTEPLVMSHVVQQPHEVRNLFCRFLGSKHATRVCEATDFNPLTRVSGYVVTGHKSLRTCVYTLEKQTHHFFILRNSSNTYLGGDCIFKQQQCIWYIPLVVILYSRIARWLGSVTDQEIVNVFSN